MGTFLNSKNDISNWKKISKNEEKGITIEKNV